MKPYKLLFIAVLVCAALFVKAAYSQPWIWSGTEDHPLANFNVETLYVALGETGHLTVYVRNINDTFEDNVTIELLGSYPEEYARFALIDPEDDAWAELYNNNRTLIAKLGPQDIRALLTVVYPNEIGKYSIMLHANSTISSTLEDNDSVIVVIRYPYTFPGLDSCSVILIFLISMFLYCFSGRE